MKQRLLELLQEEKEMKLKGGLYHQTQVKLAYNSNRIEGSRLSEDQTRYIYVYAYPCERGTDGKNDQGISQAPEAEYLR